MKAVFVLVAVIMVAFYSGAEASCLVDEYDENVEAVANEVSIGSIVSNDEYFRHYFQQFRRMFEACLRRYPADVSRMRDICIKGILKATYNSLYRAI